MSFVEEYIQSEQKRQDSTVELIASENFVSDRILSAMGSCLTNKYSEGYPTIRKSGNKGRYYGGCGFIDLIEEYCCNKWREVFSTDYHVNVQPHSGSNANMEAYMSILKPGDKILSMGLNDGGHLTHGSTVNFSGKLYQIYNYPLNHKGFINYDALEQLAFQIKPNVIVAGASAYSRKIRFDVFSDIAKRCGAYFMVDMAHIAGLIATNNHISPFGLADIITTTTHKTLRGPRGGMIFCKPELAKKVDSAVFPGCQGGPLQNIIAAKAICAEEALTDEFCKYIDQVILNSKAMCQQFTDMGYRVVTGGTDNHLFVLDISDTGFSGKQIQEELESYGITLNKNCIPGETKSPKEASGLRIGTAAMTTKGWKEKDFIDCAIDIDRKINRMKNHAIRWI